MRFSYCESIIGKKSFFIFSIEYFFEHEFNTILLRQYGLSKFFLFFSYMMFEFHNSNLNINKTFLNIGLTRSRNFAKLLLRFFQPHINIKNYFFLNNLRLMKPLTLKGKNLIAGLPMRGQRTHSNKKSIQRFRSFFSNYISNMSIANFYKFVIKIKRHSIKSKEPTPERNKKNKQKLKVKSKGAKKQKTKKTNVWK